MKLMNISEKGLKKNLSLKKILFCLILVLFSSLVLADCPEGTSSFSIQVIELETGEFVEDARVVANKEGSPYEGTSGAIVENTDSNAMAYFRCIPTGYYRIRVTKEGYESATSSVESEWGGNFIVELAKQAGCMAGQKCKDANTAGYQFGDCTWRDEHYCPYGCDETKGICKISTAETECDDGIDNDNDGLYDCNDPDCFGDPACNGKEGYFIENNECIHTVARDKIQYDTLEECKEDLEGEGLPVWLLLLIVLVVFGGLGTAIYFAVRKR